MFVGIHDVKWVYVCAVNLRDEYTVEVEEGRVNEVQYREQSFEENRLLEYENDQKSDYMRYYYEEGDCLE